MIVGRGLLVVWLPGYSTVLLLKRDPIAFCCARWCRVRDRERPPCKTRQGETLPASTYPSSPSWYACPPSSPPLTWARSSQPRPWSARLGPGSSASMGPGSWLSSDYRSSTFSSPFPSPPHRLDSRSYASRFLLLFSRVVFKAKVPLRQPPAFSQRRSLARLLGRPGCPFSIRYTQISRFRIKQSPPGLVPCESQARRSLEYALG
jgi:hypothetical protein